MPDTTIAHTFRFIVMTLFHLSSTPAFAAAQNQTVAPLGLGYEPRSVPSTVDKTVARMSRQFTLEVQKTRDKSQRPVSHPFAYTIDENKFLGEPIVARIEGHDDGVGYYLVVLHYNIPTVRATLLPVKYGFARFGVRFVAFDLQKLNDMHDRLDKVAASEHRELTAKEKAATPNAEKLDLLSIYPSSELLDMQHEEKGTNTFHVEPSWNGASAGSYQYQKERTDTYSFQLPRVVGQRIVTGKHHGPTTPRNCNRSFWERRLPWPFLQSPILKIECCVLNAPLITN
jgi:hypothetical protein